MPGIGWEKRDAHTKRKHDILGDYIKPWITITASHFSNIYIIDGFGGRGEYKNFEPGSPKIIILRACEEIKRKQSKIDCFFIEKIEELFKKMSEIVTQNNTEPEKVLTHLLNGNFTEKIYEVFNAITFKNNPCFFFIDPTGFKDLDLNILKEIGSFKRSELLLNLPTAAIKRNTKQLKAAPTIRKVLGQLPISEADDETICKIYEDEIIKKQFGFKKVQHYPVSFDRVNRPIYYLIHASNNDTGFKIMEWIRKKYGLKFTPKDPALTRQIPLSFNNKVGKRGTKNK